MLTGVAQASWSIGLGVPHPFYVAPPGIDAETTLAKSAVLSTNTEEITKVWISNYVYYVYYLEYGTEKRTPRAMVSTTLLEVHTGLLSVL